MDLSDRMKEYENVPKLRLKAAEKGDVLVVRVDGRAFHTYTKGAKSPFDEMLQSAMNDVAAALCESVQGARLAYVQSDEVSILAPIGNDEKSEMWFDGNQQKICSISAAVASVKMTLESPRIFGKMKVAQFDSRAFVIPGNEACNYLIWRQSDATRNSVQMLARSLFSHKQLHKKSCDEMKEMVELAGRPWGFEASGSIRGRCVIRVACQEKVEFVHKKTGQLQSTVAWRTRWVPDWDIPDFVRDREYVERHLQKETENEPSMQR